MRVGRRRRTIGAHREFALRVGAGRLLPRHQRVGKLERAVLHALGIQPAIGREVDVLEEHADHCLRDRRAGTVDVEQEGDRGFAGTARGGARRESGEDDKGKAGGATHGRFYPSTRLG